jgi:GNAT superfamily N-acetyltransferase
LILRGLGEHFGEVNEGLNPDLDDIGATFAQGCFVVGWAGDSLVGTGGFLPRSESIAQIQRVSVVLELRREGIGSAIVAHLLDVARARGLERVILETTETWTGVISFYERLGLRPCERRDGNLHLSLDLGGGSAQRRA